MKLPPVSEPLRYRGLYVVDFGEWTAVGYTAEEVAMLLESKAYANGKVYKIRRATADGQFELQGVSPERFALESGVFFYRSTLDAGRADFSQLLGLAREVSPPARAYVHLADLGEQATWRYVTVLGYPAEYDEEMSRWLLDAGFAGGDLIEGGISHLTNYYTDDRIVIERQQLWSETAIPSRSREEVLDSVRRAVQR